MPLASNRLHRPAETRSPDRIAVKNRGGLTVISVADIDWVEAADNYVRIHVGNRSLLVRTTMKRLESRLHPSVFVRIHRSRLVNIDRVREIHPRGSGDCIIVLSDGTRLRSSRTYKAERYRILRRDQGNGRDLD